MGFINCAMLVLTTAVLSLRLCFGTMLYYSNANTTLVRTLKELNTREFCTYALLPRFTRSGLQLASLSDDLRQRLRSFYERYRTWGKRPEPPYEYIWRHPMESVNGTPKFSRVRLTAESYSFLFKSVVIFIFQKYIS